MELPEPKDRESTLRQMARVYSEVIRVGVAVLGWSMLAFIVGCAAFVIIKVGWKFLLLILKALGEL